MARRRRNQGSAEVPYGEWLPTHAVRFNEDGTVSLMTEAQQNPPDDDAYGDPHPILGKQIKVGDRYIDFQYGYLYVEKVYPFNPKYPREQAVETDRGYRSLDPDRTMYVESLLSTANRGRRRRRNQEFYSYQSRWVPQRLMPELMNLYHTSSIIVGTTPSAKYGATVERQSWTASEFHKAHPEIKHGYIYKDLQGALGY